MEKFTLVVASLLGLQLLLRGFRLQRVPVPRLVLSIVLLALVHWAGNTVLYTLVGLLASWFVSSELGGMFDPMRDIRKGLGSSDPGRRQGAIRDARENGSDKARGTLVAQLEPFASERDRQGTLLVLHALVEEWGVEALLESWGSLSPAAREACAESLMGKTGFPASSALKIARRAMDDEGAVAAAGWRTYAQIVTAGFEGQAPEFDAARWLQESAGDPNPEIQGLRRHLEQRRFAEMQAQGVESLVARYKREVFIQGAPTQVRLITSIDHQLDGGDNGPRTLPQGAYLGTLTGKFDNAQNARAEGWSFSLQLEDVGGETWNLTSTWFSAEFFGEILDERHAADRHWFDEAPESIERAFATRAFVGPVVAYGDEWDQLAPTIQGEPLPIAGKQLLKCLIASVPDEDSHETHLAFLLYLVEDATDADEELQPFVTRIPLERLVLGATAEELIETPTVVVG